MVISLDRQSGLFNEQICDRTNHRTMQLYEDIQKMDVPQRAFRERVSIWKISTTYDMEQHCYSIGRTNIVNFTLRSDIKASNNSFIKLGELPFFAVTKVLWQTDGGIYKIEQNVISIYPFSSGTKEDHCMMWFVS